MDIFKRGQGTLKIKKKIPFRKKILNLVVDRFFPNTVFLLLLLLGGLMSLKLHKIELVHPTSINLLFLSIIKKDFSTCITLLSHKRKFLATKFFNLIFIPS